MDDFASMGLPMSFSKVEKPKPKPQQQQQQLPPRPNQQQNSRGGFNNRGGGGDRGRGGQRGGGRGARGGGGMMRGGGGDHQNKRPRYDGPSGGGSGQEGFFKESFVEDPWAKLLKIKL